jgi:hypothetical protein
MQYSSHFSVESFPNEERTWEEIMQIKAMPVNMAQKRELKLKLKVCAKIALCMIFFIHSVNTYK